MSSISIPDSQISLQGKTISMMRELAKGIFQESFMSIEVDKKSMMFIIRIENEADKKTIDYFKEKYKQCIVKVFQEVKDIPLSAQKSKMTK